MGFWSQLRLLLWKNLLLQRRKKCVTLFEISMPLLFALIFLLLRFNVSITNKTIPTLYEDFPIDQNNTAFNDENMTYGDTILFTPNSPVVNNIMKDVEIAMADANVTIASKGFPTQTDMLTYYKFNSKNVSYAIEFNVSATATTLPTSLRYILRPRDFVSKHWDTDTITPFAAASTPRTSGEPDYRFAAFLWLQRLIDEAVIKTWVPTASTTLNNLDIRLQRMPFPPYVTDAMVDLLKILFPILLMMSFILMAIQTAKGVVYEKERKLKESMKLMGLSPAAHWASWFVTIFVYIIIFSTIYTVFCGINMTGNGAVLANTDPSLFFVFLLCYGTAVTTFCFMISVFTHRANVAAAVAGIVYFITYCPYFYFQTIYEQMTRPQKLGSSLLFNIAVGFGGQVIGMYEGTGEGAQWSNFYNPPSVDDNFSLLDSMLMMLGDAAIYLVITWYVDNVFPGEFGVPQPWYFLFTARYWCGPTKVSPDSDPIQHRDDKHFEKEPSGMKTGIVIRNLRKVFGNGSHKKVAVDGMSLNMYEGQISVLLGHNGAGKTTTMSVLTGFIPATGGTARVNGYDINTDIQSVRQSLGLCPQHNILFDTLTVQEHMEFFASLKGCSGRDKKSEVEKMIQEIGLSSKRNTQSQHLSGGQKRKLSVGIALIGGSKIVILDEPTSGMDPAARRQTWDILQRNRHGRTMLLTTHFMDEADLLGDRIAIMAEGVVKCCGTSYFLKKLYGAGYHLIMVKEPKCQVTAVTSIVQRHIPTAILDSEINAEISYLLPDDQSGKYAGLFTEIEKRGRELGISTFGTTATTMEEVFLKVDVEQTEEDKMSVTGSTASFGQKKTLAAYNNPLVAGMEEEAKQNGFEHELTQAPSYGAFGDRDSEKHLLAFNQGLKKYTGIQLELSRFRGMFVKKMLHTWRNKAITITQLLLPVIFTIVALVSTQFSTPGKVEPALTLDMSPFDGTDVPYQNGTSTLTEGLAKGYISSFDGTEDKAVWVDFKKFHNMSDYFLSRINTIGLIPFNQKVIIGGEFESDSVARGHYNGEPYHSQPTSLSYIMNGILKYFATPDHSITTVNYPLPRNTSESSKNFRVVGMGVGFAISFLILFGMAFLTSSFVHFLIKERLVGAKHLQVVSGVGPFVFWMSNFVWDFINYLMTAIIVIIIFAAFQTDAFTADGRIGVILLVFVTYGWAVLPFMYCLQYWFKTPATGMVILIILNIFTGMMTVLVTYILTMLRAGKVATEVIDWIFSILFPHHAFGMTFFNMYSNYENLNYCVSQNYEEECKMGKPLPCCKDNCGKDCVEFTTDFLEWALPGIGRYVLTMAIQGVAFFMIILAIDYQIPQKIKYCLNSQDDDEYITSRHVESAHSEESDVAAERQRISEVVPSKDASDAIILKNLSKHFGNFVAVDRLSIGISERECFGLLGQNGAGKTTTFRMMTGDVMLTSGNAYLWSYDVKNNVKKVQENMGYCPQFDALIDQMTGRETLAMYARLKGVPERRIRDVCDGLLNAMMLKQYADIPTSDYSGGNKRKLSTAIALIGDPAFIMLDEPSTGMDPKARRHMWNILSKIRESGRTLILTSHSMEECDALCTKIAIMVNARFVCLGTPQHLKTKFGQGYTLVARMAMLSDGQNTAPNQPLVDFIKSNYPDTQVFDDHQGYVHFQVPYATVSLAQVFTLMEQAKVQFSVEDYSVHQTTLEQVFLSFTQGQLPPSEPPPKPICRRVCCCCYCCCCCCD